MQRISAIVMIALILSSFCVVNLLRIFAVEERLLTSNQLEEAFPQAESFTTIDNDHQYHPAISGGDEIGCVFRSDYIDPKIVGYGGEIALAVGLGKDGEIKGVSPVEHQETPAYWQALIHEGFIENFIGRRIDSDFSDIDAVSGATVTSEAIRKDLVLAAGTTANSRYGFEIELEPAPPRFEIDPTRFAFLSLALILGTFSFYKRNRPLRWLSLATSLGILGFWQNVSISLPQFVDLLQWRLPAGSNLEAMLLLAFAVFFALIGRSVYCSRICPFGALQELAYRALPFHLRPSGIVNKRLGTLRWVVLAITIIVAGIFTYSPAAAFEPFGSLFTLATPMAVTGFALLALAGSAIYRRFWCRFFCPSGACLHLLLKTNALAKKTAKTNDSEITDSAEPSEAH